MLHFHPSLHALAMALVIGLGSPGMSRNAAAQATPFGTPTGERRPVRVAEPSRIQAIPDKKEAGSDEQVSSPLQRELQALREEQEKTLSLSNAHQGKLDRARIEPLRQRALRAGDEALAAFLADAQKVLEAGGEPAAAEVEAVTGSASSAVLKEYASALEARATAMDKISKRVAFLYRNKYAHLRAKAQKAGESDTVAQIDSLLAQASPGPRTKDPSEGKAAGKDDPGGDFLGTHANKDDKRDKIRIWRADGKVRITWLSDPFRRTHESVSIQEDSITFSNGRTLTKSGSTLRESGSGSDGGRSYVILRRSHPPAARHGTWVYAFSGLWEHGLFGRDKFEIRIGKNNEPVLHSVEGSWWKEQFPKPTVLPAHSTNPISLRIPLEDGDFLILTRKDADTLLEGDSHNPRGAKEWKRVKSDNKRRR
ncbi:MAG: hypothetical protein LBG65_07445 [Puniceicoccales bacterium]|jgi:hypothetical protein|nr:hypothetical protein [Puniceicoccales bacterium]